MTEAIEEQLSPEQESELARAQAWYAERGYLVVRNPSLREADSLVKFSPNQHPNSMALAAQAAGWKVESQTTREDAIQFARACYPGNWLDAEITGPYFYRIVALD